MQDPTGLGSPTEKEPTWSNAPADWLVRLGVLGAFAFVVGAVCLPIYLVINDVVSGKLTSQPGKFAGVETGSWIVGLVFGVAGTYAFDVRVDGEHHVSIPLTVDGPESLAPA